MNSDALADAQFVMRHMLSAPRVLSALPAYAGIDGDLIDQVTEAAHEFASGVLAPLNASGDREGCRLVDGRVTTPAGFAHAWKQFVDAGWPLIAADPEDGGQGLPHVIAAVLHEAVAGANPGWDMFFSILHGGYACLRAHGSEELKSRYLRELAAGRSLVTMAMTEAHAGSDLGLARTRAIPAADGSVRLSGTKIFISGGDHDLTEQIVHLVLARLPDAPAGSRGLSLFLVPKVLPDGSRNSVVVERIEEKMGLHGSPTCTLRFDEARGWMVGEAGRGLNAMFVMMNAARIVVGLQAVGSAAAALATAEAYAAERVQGGVAIARHAAVQRLLAHTRAWTEGGRMLALWTALRLDESNEHPDQDERRIALGEVSLLTPIVKALLSEQAFAGANAALQVLGGHGYIREWGIEQRVRDLRVATLYEGTNEIQAMDLWQRKLAVDAGHALDGLLARLRNGIESPHGAEVAAASARLVGCVKTLAEADVPPGLVAPPMLKACGLVVIAALWARADDAARAASDAAFTRRKQATAKLWFAQVMPEFEALMLQLESIGRHPSEHAHVTAVAGGRVPESRSSEPLQGEPHAIDRHH